jgi:hypothetical protein
LIDTKTPKGHFMERSERGWLALAVAVIVLLIGGLFYPVFARDLGQWENGDQSVRDWYRSLMQPDNPTVPCCGEADGYWCDDIHVKGGKAYCRITDDRPDGPLGRPHRKIGEEYEIPSNKLKFDKGNPTGHSIIFLSTAGYTWCFVQNGGV